MADDPPPSYETTPLLRDDPPTPAPKPAPEPLLSGRRFTVLLTVCVFVVVLGGALTGLPFLRIIEDIVCRRNAGVVEHIDESLCKGAETQGEIAYIIAILGSLEVVPGLIMGFPYGLLADRIGRRPVLALTVLGMACYLSWIIFVLSFFENPRLIWTAHVWQFIGGGKHVFTAMAFSMIADVEPVEKLSDAFFMVIVSSLGANLLATFLSAQLMRIDPWIPVVLGLGTMCLGLLMILFLPETLHTKPASATADEATPVPENASLTAALRSRASALLADLRQSTSLIHSYPVVALLLTSLTTGVHGRALEFVPQYLSKSLGWTLSDAGMLLTVQVALNVALYVVIIPSLSRLLTSTRLPFRLDAPVKDLVLAQASGTVIAVGTLLLALPSAPLAMAGLALFTLGLGFNTLCRVVVTALVDASQTGRLYTLISVLGAAGELSAGPCIAWLFKVGLSMGDGMAGLPFLGVSLFCAVAAVLVFTVRRASLIMGGDVVGGV